MSDDDFKERMVEHMARMEQKIESLPAIAQAVQEHSRLIERHDQQISHHKEKLNSYGNGVKMVVGYVFTVTVAIIGWLTSNDIG